MKRKERFLMAVKGGCPDNVPMFDFLFQKPLYEQLIKRKPGSYNGKDAVECALALNHDAVWIPFGGFSGYQPAFKSQDVYVDEWGTTFKINEASWPIDAPIAYPIKNRSDLVKYRSPDPTLSGRTGEIEAGLNSENDDLAICCGVGGPLTTAWFLMGYEAISFALFDDPNLLCELFKISNNYYKEAARRAVNAGCVAMWISEDLGTSHGGLLNRNHFQKYVLPAINDLVDYVDSLGVPVLLHSCGRIYDYLDDLAQTKISAIHPLQRTAGMDLRHVKEKYGQRFCIIGNIDSSQTLPYGSIEDVRDEVRQAIDIGAPGGGYVIASDHSLHDGIPVENIIEMFKYAREYSNNIKT